jgi:hypothetical protein
MLSNVKPDRFATERAELRAVQVAVKARLPISDQKRYEMESIERGSRLAWLAHDKHYMLPGGYGLTAAQRLQYLKVPPYRVVVKECTFV